MATFSSSNICFTFDGKPVPGVAAMELHIQPAVTCKVCGAQVDPHQQDLHDQWHRELEERVAASALLVARRELSQWLDEVDES